MNNDELKKKIFEILFPVLKGSRISCNEENACKQCWFPCEVDRLADSLADALIASGIGDVKDLQVQVDSLEITNIALQAGYDDAEKDRLYWVDKYKEAEHRAEVAERAVYNMAYGEWQREGARRAICEKYAPSTARDYLDRAEKELAEERKDEN